MGISRGFRRIVRILHNDQLRFGQSPADLGEVGHRGGGIGPDDPDRLDLTAVHGIEHANCVVPRLGMNGPGGQAPERFHLPAVLRIGDEAVSRKAVAGVADVAAAHGVGLARQAEWPQPGRPIRPVARCRLMIALFV